MEQITSRQNERAREIALLCEHQKHRRATGLCVAHGPKLCAEALRLGAVIESLWMETAYYAAHETALAPLIDAAASAVLMSDSVCDKLTPQRSPQGLLAVVRLPRPVPLQTLAGRERIVALCSIQDPANVGAILRTAAALGYGGALLCGECADPFSPKALRASMGAAFAVDLAQAEALPALAELRQAGHVLVATALCDGALPLEEVLCAPRMTLVIGNEGAGLSRETVAACDVAAVIPMTDRAESLNAAVAAGIAMWRFRP